MHLRHKSQTAMMILDYESISDQVRYIQSQINDCQEAAIKMFRRAVSKVCQQLQYLDCENILTTLGCVTSGTPHTVIGPAGGRWGSIVFKLVFNCRELPGPESDLPPPQPAAEKEEGKWRIIINRFCFVLSGHLH